MPCLSMRSVLNASSSNNRPFRIPLLRKVVAIPNSTPDISTDRSWFAELGPSWTMLFVKNRQPVKLNREHELSAKGAERNMPAGEMIWIAAVVKANPAGEWGKTAEVR